MGKKIRVRFKNHFPGRHEERFEFKNQFPGRHEERFEFKNHFPGRHEERFEFKNHFPGRHEERFEYILHNPFSVGPPHRTMQRSILEVEVVFDTELVGLMVQHQ